ncbi:MAG: radical SAM protein, partial [Deltaproteobacteria bacterium]|nr:radical SAM protein [Deltaproteobacteria bacterium]
MRYIGNVYRPPSEAESLIIQVTLGCSHNKCSFCGSYLDKPFSVRSIKEISADLSESTYIGPVRRVFLADGDALCIPQKRLIEIVELVNKFHPEAERIGTYASARDILRKSLEELKELKKLKLGIIYLGVYKH